MLKKIKPIAKNPFLIFSGAILVALVVYTTGPILAQSLQDIQQEIQSADSDIEEYQNRIEELQDKEDSLKNQLEILAAEIEHSEAQLSQTEAEITEVEEQIVETEEELALTESLIKEHGRTLYKEGSPSTLEILFASDNFNDFINRQEYLERTKDGLNDAAQEVVQLKNELEDEQERLTVLQAEQEEQRARLASSRQHQEDLLEETRGEEERYQDMVAEREEERQEMIRMQEEALARAAARSRDNDEFITTSGSGGYRWDGQGLTVGNCSYDSDISADIQSDPCVDKWRLYKGQCTSYVAWRLASEGYRVYDFVGLGHAAQWESTTTGVWADSHGSKNAARVRNTPKPGNAAVDPNLAPPYGHVMYVEDVHADGTITVSEYNYVGRDVYSERRISQSGLTFLEFARQ